MPDALLTEEIRRRAYEIWETEGRPKGRQVANWLQAEAECLARFRQIEAGEAASDKPPRSGDGRARPSRKSRARKS